MKRILSKLEAGSILELIIAMSIIAASMAIFTMIYASINQASKTLNEMNDQGYSYSKFLYMNYVKDTLFLDWNSDFSEMIVEDTDFNNEKGKIIKVVSFRGKLLWETERITNDKIDEELIIYD